MSEDPLISKKDQSISSDLNPQKNIIRIPEMDLAVNSTEDKGQASFTSKPNPSEDAQLQLALRNHAYITEFIKLADQKAGVVFTLATGFIALLHKDSVQSHFLKPLDQWIGSDLVNFLALLTLMLGASFSFVVVKPNLRPRKAVGLIFWESVAEFKEEKNYLKMVMNLNKQGVIEELFDHHFQLSRVCFGKYKWLNRSIIFSSIGVLLSVLILIF